MYLILSEEVDPADLGQPQSVAMATGIGGEGMGQTFQSSHFEEISKVSLLDWFRHGSHFKGSTLFFLKRVLSNGKERSKQKLP